MDKKTGKRVAKALEEIAELLRGLYEADQGGPITDAEMIGIAAENDYLTWKRFPDGTLAAVFRMAFTYALVSEIDRHGYGRRWCYSDRMKCLDAFEEWQDVAGHPEGWHRAVHTGERRDEHGNFIGVW